MSGDSCVRSDPADGRIRSQFSKGQRDAIDSERALGNAESLEVGGEADFETMVLSMLGPIEDFAHGVDMALHEVATKAVTDAKGALEVDLRTFFQLTKRGDLEGLGEDVEGGFEDGDLSDGETAAVDGHGISEREFACEGKVDGETGLFVFFNKAENSSNCFDETGEHRS